MLDFLRENWAMVLEATEQHLALVFVAMLAAVLIGIPTGILLTRQPLLQRPVLGLANIMQTVPSLALFGLLLPLLGLGAKNAIVALVLYSLLPIIRNTVTGIQGVDRHVREAAVAMGMTDGQILRQVELPLAASVILAGMRVATVLCIGITTIASFIGAGGLGEIIQNGLRELNNAQTLAGAVPAALLALAADGVLGTLQKQFEARSSNVRGTSGLRRFAMAPAILLLLLGMVGTMQGLRSLAGIGRGTPVPNTAGTTKSGGILAVGSKDFTESRILAEIIAQAAEAKEITVRRAGSLGGSLPHQALLSGKLDCYPEYTGTAYIELLKHPRNTDAAKVYSAVKQEYADKLNLAVSPPLGFEDTFAMLVRGEDARKLSLKTVSQTAPYAPQWVAGFGPDFISRADGYPGFKKTYNLHFAAVRSMDLSLINRALAAHKVDLIAGNSTDGLIPSLDLFQLEDDKHYFPPYQAIYVVRQAALDDSPALAPLLQQLGGAISTEEMRKLNYEVDGKKRKVAEVVKQWLASKKF